MILKYSLPVFCFLLAGYSCTSGHKEKRTSTATETTCTDPMYTVLIHADSIHATLLQKNKVGNQPTSGHEKSPMALYMDSLGLVNIAELDSSIAISLMYTQADNFTGEILYDSLAEAYLHVDAAHVPAYGDPKKWENWSLSKTLEYAYDDYCIATMAKKMGKKEIADEFYKRAQNYRNVYNPATSFMQPRDEKGNFAANFSPDDYTEDICESNGWQYFWSVPQDLDGLVGLVGSKERFAEKLDSMFTYVPKSTEDLPIFSTGMIGQYAHGNEPSHHVIYLYNKVGQPWKTQKYVAEVLHNLYQNAPDGICGNEDCGQMSAWFVFSSMGFYPVDPISGKYEIGTPIFPEVKMHLANGKTFAVLAPAVSRENIYVQSVKLNGRPYDKSYITHEQIMNGDTLEFEMGNRPGPVWYNNM